MSSMNVQKVTSQMIPTPGFINNNPNQSYMNIESSSNGGGFSTVESTMVSQPQQTKQHIGGQNSRILHNLGSQMGGGIRSSLEQKSYGFSNGAINGGLGLMGSNLPSVNEHGTSEGYLTSTSYVNPSKPSQHHFDQHQRSVMPGTISLSPSLPRHFPLHVFIFARKSETTSVFYWCAIGVSVLYIILVVLLF